MEAKLQDCETIDVDWILIPPNIQRACSLIAKTFKQKPITVLLGILVLISFALGHASIKVDADWVEPIIIWIATAIPTGRCKSAFHQWLQDVIEEVESKLKRDLKPVKPMILTNCTWERFGERMAESGGRQLGLFDELTSFFSTMNMYSSQKQQVSDTKEYQDFLQMFTGKTKTRETITGNANFSMQMTSFSMMGFTQPFAALPIIKDVQNCVKGFTSRILWMFPKPIFCTMSQRRLSEEEKSDVQEFRTLLVDFLTSIYEVGESSYSCHEENKVKIVKVKRREFIISEDAQENFDNLHDEWENLCEQSPHDSLIGGLYSRGKAQVLRLSVPIQLLLEMTNDADAEEQVSHNEQSAIVEEEDNEHAQSQHSSINDEHNVEVDEDDDEDDDEDIPVLKPLEFHQRAISNVVGKTALDIAKSITTCSIRQQCIINEKEPSEEHNVIPANVDPMTTLYKAILLTESTVVSFTLLSQKGMFRRTVNGQSGRALIRTVSQSIHATGLGNMESFVSPGNNAHVYFFKKADPPNSDDMELSMEFSEKVSRLGISLPKYKECFKSDGQVFEKHNEEYEMRKQAQPLFPSPPKRPRKQ